MKKLVSISVFVLALIFTVSASTNTVVANGNWGANNTWSLNRIPANGDTIMIPGGKTVTVTSNYMNTSNNWFIKIHGVLRFDGGKLNMSSTSKVWLYAGGTISSNGNSNADVLKINSVDKYKGNQGNLSGEKYADASTGTAPGGFNTPLLTLPVVFISFNAARQNSDVLIQWSTAQEINSDYFEVQHSENGNDWNILAKINGAGKTSSITSYSYTDKSVTTKVSYYRIRQFDLDGKFIVTGIRVVKNDSKETEIKINAASVNSIYVHFSQLVKANVVVRLSSTNGQVVAQQSINNPVGQVMIPFQNANRGIYIVTVTDGQDLKFSKQVLL